MLPTPHATENLLAPSRREESAQAADDPARRFAEIPLAQIDPDPVQVRTRNDQDLREVIFQRIAKNGWGLRRLDLRRRSLEDHFMEVLREEDPLLGRRFGKESSEAIQAANN